MPPVYCLKCGALTSDRAGRCHACGRRDPGGRRAVTAGALVVSALAGAAATAAFARAVYLGWPRWVRACGYDPDWPEPGGHAEELAVIAGAVVFMASALTAFLCL